VKISGRVDWRTSGRGMGRDVTPLTSVQRCKGGKVQRRGRGDQGNGNKESNLTFHSLIASEPRE